MLWIIAQVLWIGYKDFLQPLYLGTGVIEAIERPRFRRRQHTRQPRRTRGCRRKSGRLRSRRPGEPHQDPTVVEEALAKAVRDALRLHKRAGNPIPEWRDGKVRWLDPEEIPDLVVTS